jgi:hypothetical protein
MLNRAGRFKPRPRRAGSIWLACPNPHVAAGTTPIIIGQRGDLGAAIATPNGSDPGNVAGQSRRT